MEFSCVDCGYTRQMSDSLQGKRIKCASCGKVQQLPPLRDSNSSTDLASEVLGRTTDPTRTPADGQQVAVKSVNSESTQEAARLDSDAIDWINESPQKPVGKQRSGAQQLSAGTPVTPRPQSKTTANPSDQPSQVKDYKVKRTALGMSVAYGCPHCGERLTNPGREAGGLDHCPRCRQAFIVPGANEYQQQLANETLANSVRKANQEELTEASKKAVINRVAEAALKAKDVQLTRDPLKEWIVYLAIMTVLMAIAAGRYLIAAVAQDSSYLCVVIIALFFIGLFLNFSGVMRLRNEYVCAAVCMGNLYKPNGLMQVTKGPAAGVLHQHIMDLAAISRHDENFTQDSLVTLLYSRMMARSKIVEILGAVLVTLGLIGTIVGLIQMTDGLSLTLSSLDSKQQSTELLNGMRSTMSGLGTAFNTTLVGALLGSVVLRILNTVYTSNVDQLVTYVASTAEVSIVPRLKHQQRQANQLNAETL